MIRDNSRVIQVILAALFVVLLASYSIYTAVRFFYSPYRTMTAFTYTVADSYKGQAVAIRKETVLRETVEGVLGYTCEDGEVVIPGMTVARVYDSEEQLQLEAGIEEREAEIQLLQEAQRVGGENLSTESIAAKINECLGLIADSVEYRSLEELSTYRRQLSLSMARQRIATGREADFSQRIAFLEEDLRFFRERALEGSRTISAKEGGYFCSTVDGYEELLTPDFESYTLEDYRRAINGTMKPDPSADGIGKLQKGHRWFLAMVVDREDVGRFEQGAAVFLDFGKSGCSNIPAVIQEVRVEKESGDALILMQVDNLTPTLINLRQAAVTVRFRSYTGLRISLDALRYQDQVEGVYVKQGLLIVFKPIERIYTGDDFVLCSDAATGERALRLFDDIVIKGGDLYDGKII